MAYSSISILDSSSMAQTMIVYDTGSGLLASHDIKTLGGVAIAQGTGVRSSGTMRVTVATDDVVPVTGTFWQATQPVSIAANVTVVGTGTFVTQSVCTNSGTFAVQAAQSGTWTVGLSAAQTLATVTTVSTVTVVSAVTAITNALPAGSNLLGKVGIDQTTPGTTNGVSVVATSLGGLSLYSLIAVGTSGDATNVKASAGKVCWVYVVNGASSVRYLKFYDSASAPTAGSGTPVLRLPIPPNFSGFMLNNEVGLAFATGIGFTMVTGQADNNSTGVTANDCTLNIGYK